MTPLASRTELAGTLISHIRTCRAPVNDDGRTAHLYPHTNIGGGPCGRDGGMAGGWTGLHASIQPGVARSKEPSA